MVARGKKTEKLTKKWRLRQLFWVGRLNEGKSFQFFGSLSFKLNFFPPFAALCSARGHFRLTHIWDGAIKKQLRGWVTHYESLAFLGCQIWLHYGRRGGERMSFFIISSRFWDIFSFLGGLTWTSASTRCNREEEAIKKETTTAGACVASQGCCSSSSLQVMRFKARTMSTAS